MTREDNILNHFIVSVYEHCHAERTVQYYADEQHLSLYYFSSIIKERSGKGALQWIENFTMMFMSWFQAIIDDKNRMEATIRQSNLDWTIVRCTTIKDGKAKGNVKASLDGKGLKFSITAPDMASFFVEQI